MFRIVRLSVLFFLCLMPMVATAADRVALVVGMSRYEHIGTLKNTVNDAKDIAAVLEGIGFEVTTLLDGSYQDLQNTLDSFSFTSETADLALIYFAGHGIEVQGENFLVPVDAYVTSNRDVQRSSVSLKDFMKTVDRARKMRIVILDSCRNNPFGDALDLAAVDQSAADDSAPAARGQGGGLAPATPDRGTLVAFAARDGEVALDGEGDNSPFAMALVEKLAEPGLEISLMFRQIRDQVLNATGNQQEPHTYGSLSGTPFYLAGPTETQLTAQVQDRSRAWSEIRPDQQAQLAQLAKDGDTRSMLGLAYMRLNPEQQQFDPSGAVEWLEKAAEAGSAEAQFELAKLYETGLGVTQDSARALELYQASAGQDFTDAINDLGFLHHQGGLGLVPNPKAAMAQFERAADLRHPQAMFNFAALIDDGVVQGKGPEDAAKYLYDALRTGSPDVLNILAERPTMFQDATRKALQVRLRENEFYSGGIDGDFGPGTQRGIRRAYGLDE